MPPPSHSWMAPLAEVMLRDARTDSPKQWRLVQAGQFFSTGDIQWGMA